MEIIHEIRYNDTDALRLFTSTATPRKNNLRIHYHSQIEISLILKGNGIYRSGGKTYSIEEGNIFFFRPNEAHCITDIADTGMSLLNLHIAPYYLYTHFQNALSSRFIQMTAANFPLISNKINDTLSKEIIEKIKELLLSIRAEFENKENDYLSVAHNYISTILIFFSRAYDMKRFSQKEKQNYRKLLSAVQYIDSHFRENITLETLSKEVAYSRCYFSSTFKKYMGMSVWDYISIKRIEEALTLIKTTDKNILDIALECGFNNTVNFNKLFKKYTNLSPGSFRK